MTVPEHHRDSVQRRRWLVLGGLGAAVVVLRLLSSCAAPAGTGAAPDPGSEPTRCTTCSAPEVPGPTG
ncbi:MAG: hypothetical protein FWH11_05725 [Micrococcales bacterium]|nr:hypothetical protein [Micrococcales bacterium]